MYRYIIFLGIICFCSSGCFKNEVEALQTNALIDFYNYIESVPLVTLEGVEFEQHPNNSTLKRAVITLDCICSSFTEEEMIHFTSISNIFTARVTETGDLHSFFPSNSLFITNFLPSDTTYCFEIIHFHPDSGQSYNVGDFCIDF